MARNTLTKHHEALDRAKKRILVTIDAQAQEAVDNIDALAHLFGIAADYAWLKDQVLSILPLGVGGRYLWVEEQLVRRFAKEVELAHFADALIDELNGDPYGHTIIPSRASIIMRDDESMASRGKRP